MRISDWSSDVCSSDLHRVGYRREDRAEVVFLRPQRVLGGPTFGDVRHYRRKAAQIAVGRMESGDRDVGKKLGPVFAKATVFDLEPALPFRPSKPFAGLSDLYFDICRGSCRDSGVTSG